MAGGSLTLSLLTAQSGLLTNQQALNTIAQNVSNVNTPGYSRKIVRTEQRVLNGIGSGVQLAEVTRNIDEGLLKSVREQLSETNNYLVQDGFYARMQEMFGAPGANTSISHFLTEFTATLEAFATSPDTTIEQADVVRAGQDITNTLATMTNTIQELRLQADQEITSTIEAINQATIGIADLNDKIIRSTSTNIDTADLKDQRDAALDALSELIDIRYFSSADGDVIVFSAEGKTLVSNIAATITHAASGAVASTATHAEGDFTTITVSNGNNDIGSQQDITTELRDGKIKGLIDLRDTILSNLQSQVDELAAEVRDVFNQIHNRGTPFPGSQEMSGTRRFVDPATQVITYSGTDDTRVTLFDSNGDQTATTTIRAADVLNSNTGTISTVAANLQTWIRANGAAAATVSFDTAGQMNIALNSTTAYIGFRDESSSTAGSTLQDATIGFNSDGNVATGETVGGIAGNDVTITGFSNFFGLNDFFLDNQVGNIQESNVVSNFAATAATLNFEDASGLLAGSPFTVTAGESLQTIATNITNNVTNVTASVVPDGAGFRLRISHGQSLELVVTQNSGNTLLTDLGLHKADVRTASSISVRSDIAASPSGITHGVMQWDANLGVAGEYFNSNGDATISTALSDAFTSTNAFDAAGGLPTKSLSFSDYASSIIANNSSLGASNEAKLDFNSALADSLLFKANSDRGVNLDEEMAALILFEQAFSASARVITVIQNMFDALERALG